MLPRIVDRPTDRPSSSCQRSTTSQTSQTIPNSNTAMTMTFRARGHRQTHKTPSRLPGLMHSANFPFMVWGLQNQKRMRPACCGEQLQTLPMETRRRARLRLTHSHTPNKMCGFWRFGIHHHSRPENLRVFFPENPLLGQNVRVGVRVLVGIWECPPGTL